MAISTSRQEWNEQQHSARLGVGSLGLGAAAGIISDMLGMQRLRCAKWRQVLRVILACYENEALEMLRHDFWISLKYMRYYEVNWGDSSGIITFKDAIDLIVMCR